MGKAKTPATVRFWKAVRKHESGCWLFGDKPKYGQITTDDGRNIAAHRFSWLLHVGPVPRGKFLCHKCDVKNCVNPDHIYVGDHEDNTKDIVDRGRTARNTARIALVARPGELPQNRKLTREHAERMRSEYATGKWTQAQLAKRYSVSQGTVSATIRGVKNMGAGHGGKTRTGNFRRKLSPETLQIIKELYATKQFTQQQLAERFGCDQTYVSLIVRK